MVCSFKLAVYVDEGISVITKTDHDFIRLGGDLKKLFPNRSEVELPEFVRKHSNLM